MTQDTRKDPRAKIVSLNVRYKSATVDEFIDNHSHDVSKGGIFIKTPSPFPPGTLLKFEIRIAGDKAVIAGVGRVVWKRETAQSNSEQPAGMGVKFIKIDDPSRAIIDRLVDTKGGGRGAYDEGGGDSAVGPPPTPEAATSPAVHASAKDPRKGPPKPAPAAAARPQTVQPKPQPGPARSPSVVPAAKPTMLGLGSIPVGGIGTSKTAPTPAAGRPAGDDVRRHTPHGMGAPRPGSSQAPPAAGAGRAGSLPPAREAPAMFPKTNSEKEMPPTGDQTVMKQAAELLEEALRGAGGSMDEIGQNPLFDQVSSKTKDAESAATLAKLKEPSGLDRPKTMQGVGPTDVDELMKPTAELEQGVAAERARRSDSAPAMPPPHGASPVSAGAQTPSVPKGTPSPASAVAAVAEPPPKNRWLVPLLLVAAAGGLGFFAYAQMHAVPTESATPTPAPPPSASASATPSALPSASAPAASASAEPIPSSAPDAATVTAIDASSPGAAKAAAAAAPTPVAPWHPPPRKPAAATPIPTPPSDNDDNTPPTPPTTGGSTPAPSATVTDNPSIAPAPTSSVPKAGSAKPATKPKADDDNPY
jgi:uncharacterized protein (TIGR02266 family)